VIKTLDVTPDQITEVCREIYEADGYRHAPAQLLIDHAWGEATYLRVSFPEEFSGKAAEQLTTVISTLKGLYGANANVVVVIYGELLDPDAMARHSLRISDR